MPDVRQRSRIEPLSDEVDRRTDVEVLVHGVEVVDQVRRRGKCETLVCGRGHRQSRYACKIAAEPTEPKVDVTCANPAQHEQTREECEYEEFDGLAYEVRRVYAADEAT